MPREITQHELRSEAASLIRALENGESFILIGHDGVAVAELTPIRRPSVPAEAAMRAFSGVGRIDPLQFRADVDAVVDQDPQPRC